MQINVINIQLSIGQKCDIILHIIGQGLFTSMNAKACNFEFKGNYKLYTEALVPELQLTISFMKSSFAICTSVLSTSVTSTSSIS